MMLRRAFGFALGVMLLALPWQAVAQSSFKTFATISATLGNTQGRVCVGAPISGGVVGAIGCPAAGPQIVGGGISASGIVTATFFEGDGSRLTGVGSGTGDRITSGTLAITANSSTSVVSLSTAGTTWGYLGSAASYLPQLTVAQVSATNISGSLVQVGSGNGAACDSARRGALRFSTTSNTLEYCNSAAWTGVTNSTDASLSAFSVVKTSVQSVNDGDIVTWDAALTNNGNAFNLATERFVAPASGYYFLIFTGITGSDTTSLNLFIYKNGAQSGLRSYAGFNGTHTYRPGTAQGVLYLQAGDYVDVRSGSNGQTVYGSGIGESATTFSGFLLNAGSAGSGGASNLSELGDVNVAGATSGSILAYNGSAWVVSSTGSNSGALGDRITSGSLAIMANSNTSVVSLSTGGTTWGYLSNLMSYLPQLTAGQLSATNISGSLVQVGNGNGAACDAARRGALRYSTTSSVVEYCNSSAWVSMGPSSTVPVSFHATRGGTNQTISANTTTKVQLTTEVYDSNNNFDNATNYRFTPTVPGRYVVHGSIYCSGSTGYTDAVIAKNGATAARSAINTGGDAIVPVSGIFDMNGSSDYLELFGLCQTGTTFSGSPQGTFLMGSLISPQGGGGGGADNLNDLGDVNTAGASTGSILAYNGSSWVVSNTGGGGASGPSDRIVSGTSDRTRIVAVSSTSFISITQNSTETGWFDPSRGLVTLGVSATGVVSGTSGYFSNRLAVGGAHPTNTGRVYSTGAANFAMEPNSFGTTSGYTALVIGATSGATESNGGLYAIGRRDKANEPFVALSGWDNGSQRTLYFGGGGWETPDATRQLFYTASTYNENNDAGSLRMLLAGNGDVALGGSINEGDYSGSVLVALSSGRVGINAINPLANLDVVGTISASGAIQVGTSGLACTGGIPGAIRYNSGNLEYCNGSSWSALGGGGGGGGPTDRIVSGSAVALISPTGTVFVRGRLEIVTGTDVVAIGSSAAEDNAGEEVLAIGREAASNNGGDEIHAIGYRSAWWNSGNYSQFWGPYSGGSNSGDSVIGIGTNSAGYNEGESGVFIGVGAGYWNVGDGVVAVGGEALANNSVAGGDGSVAIGNRAGRGASGGSWTRDAVFIGDQAGLRVSSTDLSVFIGSGSGEYFEVGDYNLLIGSGAGSDLVSGDNNIVIGTTAQVPSTTGSGQLNIGAAIYGVGVTGMWGSMSSDARIGIKVANPLADFAVNGTISATNAIQVGSSSLACSAGIPGAIRYNSGSIEYCNGAAWAALGSGGGGTPDRIVSGSLAMTANSATSIVSLSTGGTTWGYLGSARSYLPEVMAGRVSATNISASIVQLSQSGVSCTPALYGSLHIDGDGDLVMCGPD